MTFDLDFSFGKLERSRWRWVPQLVMWCLLGMVLVNTAWICDDAYITFRTVDNILNGYGATWNPDERVQVYTHPLWMLVHLVFEAVFHNIYVVTLCLSLGLSLGTVYLVGRSVKSYWIMLALPLVIISSKAFTEFSTSGLENPLSHFLLALFVMQWWRHQREGGRLLVLVLLMALLMLCRMDYGPLMAPAVAVAFWRERSWKAVREVCVGMLPFVAWEVFSVIYYGVPFPNTAYAKLGAGIPQSELWRLGFGYFRDSIHRDPVTLPMIALGIFAGFRLPRQWPLVVGILLYLFYVLRIGADYMSGRFFTACFLISLMLIIKMIQDRQWWGILLTLVAFGIGLLGPTPTVVSGSGYRLPNDELLSDTHVADERSFNYPATGLLRALEGQKIPDYPGMSTAQQFATMKEKFVYWNTIGFFGYIVGPDKYVIDGQALADPLLARMPALYNPSPRAGHFLRASMPGYEESLMKDQNLIVHPVVHEMYGLIRDVTRGPLFSKKRWESIWRLNMGLYTRPSVEQFSIPLAQTIQLPVSRDRIYTMVDNQGIKFLLPKGGASWLSFAFNVGAKGLHLAWLKGDEPIGGGQFGERGNFSVPIPKGADAVALYPSQPWPSTKVTLITLTP